jgi:hypothetical protein
MCSVLTLQQQSLCTTLIISIGPLSIGSVHGRGVIFGGNGGGKTRRSGSGVGVVTAAGGLV